MKENGLNFGEYVKLISYIVKYKSYDFVKESFAKLREDMIASSSPVLDRLPSLYKECYFFAVPISEETKVQKGSIVDVLEKDGEMIYYFIGDDGEIYNDDDETVMRFDKKEVETILNEMKENLS